VVRCPRCDAPLTLHVSAGENLQCHHCGYTRQKPKKCPDCGGAGIAAYGLGSEKVEAEVQALFPNARTLRWDADSTRAKDAHELILGHFAAGRADVLVGTQMLAKGLDLPRVTLVGIVMADVGLYLPDPFAAERVFQTLTQVAGRAGRSSMGGRVVLQTFSPDHYALRAAATHDVGGFYALELAQRQRLGYPPFARLVRIEYRHTEAAKAEEEVRGLAARISRRLSSGDHPQTSLIGPAPSFFSRLNGEYRWQIVLRTPDPAALLQESFPGIRPPGILQGWRVEMDPLTLL
jgi:primosomal protein N' (replication factor Y)